MIVRALLHLGLALSIVASTGCAGEVDGATRSPVVHERPSRAQIYDRDRTLVAGVATSLALGVVGLGTLLASGIFAAPSSSSEPHRVPTAVTVAGGVMSSGFLLAVPFAIGADRHRARHPEYFPGGRGRQRVAGPPPGMVRLPAASHLVGPRRLPGPSGLSPGPSGL